MTAQSIAVSQNTAIPYVEYEDQPVVTFAMTDKAHGKAPGQARRQFDRNRKHFIEGDDFYRVDFSQKCHFDSFGITIPPRGIIVLTESGYLLLVKSFTDDLAWQVQKRLIKDYFRAKALPAPEQPAERLPAPAIPAARSAAVRQAVNRRAHALSLRQYDYIREQLKAAIERHGAGLTEAEIIEKINRIDLPDSAIVCVHRDELWAITNPVAGMAVFNQEAIERIEDLEQSTGCAWYTRIRK